MPSPTSLQLRKVQDVAQSVMGYALTMPWGAELAYSPVWASVVYKMKKELHICRTVGGGLPSMCSGNLLMATQHKPFEMAPFRTAGGKFPYRTAATFASAKKAFLAHLPDLMDLPSFARVQRKNRVGAIVPFIGAASLAVHARASGRRYHFSTDVHNHEHPTGRAWNLVEESGLMPMPRMCYAAAGSLDSLAKAMGWEAPNRTDEGHTWDWATPPTDGNVDTAWNHRCYTYHRYSVAQVHDFQKFLLGGRITNYGMHLVLDGDETTHCLIPKSLQTFNAFQHALSNASWTYTQ